MKRRDFLKIVAGSAASIMTLLFRFYVFVATVMATAALGALITQA
jgi:hypothetical protein